MDLIHFIRAFNKKERTYKNDYTKGLLKVLKQLDTNKPGTIFIKQDED